MQLSHSSKTNSNTLISKWLSERQTVIVALSNLCNLRPFASIPADLLNENLQEFCAGLVDYISLGHFEVYEYISDTIDQSGCQAGIPECVLQCLMDTTIDALDFNDKYLQQKELTSLDRDLSKLALIFAQRLEWEDQLIGCYQLAKRDRRQVAKTA